jgi:glycosyltransferase involved in cell wall biosynthesis
MKTLALNFLFLILLIGSSCSEKYYTEADFHKIKKIDAHIHIRTTTDAVSDQAKEDSFQLINVNVASSDSTLQEQEKYTDYQVAAHPEQILFLDAFSMKNWGSPDWTELTIRHLKESFAKGALGIKVWKNIGMVEKDKTGNFIMIDDPRFDSVIQYIIDQHKTLLGHIGEPRDCWLPLDEMTVNNDREYYKNMPMYYMYLHPDYPTYQQLIDARDLLLVHHPDLRFVGAHLGSLEYDVDSLSKRLDRFPNMAVDVAERVCHLEYQSKTNREKIRNFMIKYQDRIIYGSDLGMRPNNNPDQARARLHKRWLEEWLYFTTDKRMVSEEVNGEFQGLQLPKAVIDKIYYKNAVIWYTIKDD